MTRIPSSADLAALRWQFHEHGPDHDAAPDGGPSPYCPVDGPRTPAPEYVPTGGAWPHELRDGIGWRLGPNLYRWGGKDRPRVPLWIPPFARRKASASRSRAYDRMIEAYADDAAWCDTQTAYRRVLDPLNAAMEAFEPRGRILYFPDVTVGW